MSHAEVTGLAERLQWVEDIASSLPGRFCSSRQCAERVGRCPTKIRAQPPCSVFSSANSSGNTHRIYCLLDLMRWPMPSSDTIASILISQLVMWERLKPQKHRKERTIDACSYNRCPYIQKIPVHTIDAHTYNRCLYVQ